MNLFYIYVYSMKSIISGLDTDLMMRISLKIQVCFSFIDLAVALVQYTLSYLYSYLVKEQFLGFFQYGGIVIEHRVITRNTFMK